ncbi:MAG: outer membrane beta-barrel protein, partial [Bacteroidetes bacterium]|nr:outer membrane beta-barrel protein [Bacteroidota bacterium]
LMTVPAESQVTVQLGAGAGIRLPMGEFGGETTEYYAGSKYGLSTGYNLQAKGRIGLGGITLVGGVEYGHLSNSGEGEAGRGKVEVSQSILTIKAGPEFSSSIPGLPLTPYVGANVAWHSISGETTFQGLTKVPSGTIDVAAASRIGFGINGGVLIKLGPAMNLDLGAEYAFINPLSKEWQVAERSNIRVDSYRSLNDEKDPLYAAGSDDHFVSASRSISTFQITATLMIGI